ARAADEARPTEAIERGEREVVGDGERRRQALALAVLAEQADALGEPLRGRRRTDPGAHRDGAGAHRIEAEDGAQQLGAPRADEAGDAQHLAAAEGEAGAPGL